ncbi:hypothetical protein [Streptomyces sp. TLI_171]|uniref:hypothetical protein n=1 Tax=Streptomyces sp. TLI_171 TaxID=1938859 RepID=UPI000C6A305A|nr:hypothetical protein [Streptomyces sp. TLI_171]RKE23380.1 hypothetical protein BX266_6848 [Streptomyces sp. TLI_171]
MLRSLAVGAATAVLLAAAPQAAHAGAPTPPVPVAVAPGPAPAAGSPVLGMIPIGTPIALLFIPAALIFLPVVTGATHEGTP